jgi:hypothetical protein
MVIQKMVVRYELYLKDETWDKVKKLADKQGLSLGKFLNKILSELPTPEEEDLIGIWR